MNKSTLYERISELLEQARTQVVRSVNSTMVHTYFEIGRIIVEDEQQGNERAEYGKEVLKELSKQLTKQFGKGFSVENLDRMRFFFRAYSSPKISSTVLTKLTKGESYPDSLIQQAQPTEFNLSWSHYLKLMRIDDLNERQFYEIEATTNSWSVRELQRQFDSGLYQRLTLSRDKKKIKELSQKGHVIQKPQDIIKDPYILEFIGLPEQTVYTEKELETKLTDKLEQFLLELGKGFTFVDRQKRITIDEKHFYVDLVFYNRILRCFVLIDLKIGELKHQDLGQIQMYVNYYDRFVKLKDENPTIGIVLCRDKNDMLVEITLPKDNQQIFASKYKTVLPSKAEFKKLLKQN
ncbi:MAG: putative nuclease YhcG [Turneriella sp.]|nr:putative nuclease YhcG [Turneriella sp.]